MLQFCGNGMRKKESGLQDICGKKFRTEDLAGETASYANLLLLFVDDRFKRHGIGRLLLQEACRYAKKLGAEKLFLSAIPSEDTIAFYQNMGCVDAKEIVNPFVDDEEDRLMEITTKDGN